MKTLKRFIAMAMVLGLASIGPIGASAQPMMGYGQMGPGMGGMGPGMMGGYGTGQGMMGPGGGYGMGPGMMGPGMMGGYGMGPGMMWAPYGDVNLTDEQNAKIATIQEEFSKKQWDVMNQMQDEQFKLQQLYSAPTRDSAAINEQFGRINQLRRQMWGNMAEARKKSDAVLTNEQRNAVRRWSGRHMMWGW